MLMTASISPERSNSGKNKESKGTVMERHAGNFVERSLLIALVWAFISSSTAFGKDETLRRSLVLAKGGRVTVENTRGNIRISSWDQDRVELVAEKQGLEEDMELVPVDIRARDDEINISSVFPEYAPDLRVTVDYRLRVPENVDLKLIKTVNGEIEVSDIAGRASLWTDHGGITVKSFSGILRVETTTYGDIDVELTDVAPADTINLKNYNGRISIRLPEEVDAFWIVRTLNGKIESDIPFETKNNFGPYVAHHPNEAGEPLIRAYSVNGEVHIDQK
jgi:DUF4097 and DUF4098 domain-containing protein YvlB